jgi:hypothetical protein
MQVRNGHVLAGSTFTSQTVALPAARARNDRIRRPALDRSANYPKTTRAMALAKKKKRHVLSRSRCLDPALGRRSGNTSLRHSD